jgi:hypothetical protein
MSDFKTVKDEADELEYCARVAAKGTREVGKGNELSYLQTARAGAWRRSQDSSRPQELREAARVAAIALTRAAEQYEADRGLPATLLMLVADALRV